MRKKKQKKLLRNHERHHEAIHQWIIRKKVEDGDFGEQIPEQHVMPVGQPWHVPSYSCACQPLRFGLRDPVTGADYWFHGGWIH